MFLMLLETISEWKCLSINIGTILFMVSSICFLKYYIIGSKTEAPEPPIIKRNIFFTFLSKKSVFEYSCVYRDDCGVFI